MEFVIGCDPALGKDSTAVSVFKNGRVLNFNNEFYLFINEYISKQERIQKRMYLKKKINKVNDYC